MKTRTRISMILGIIAVLFIIFYFLSNLKTENGGAEIERTAPRFFRVYSNGSKKEETIPKRTSGILEAIEKHEIMLGMTKKQVIESWGKPNDINHSVGSWGVHEQWIYESKYGISNTYLYFENDTLTSWQD